MSCLLIASRSSPFLQSRWRRLILDDKRIWKGYIDFWHLILQVCPEKAPTYRLFEGPLFTLGKANGSFSLAIKWLAASAFESFIFVLSVSVGTYTFDPISRKYCLILLIVSLGQPRGRGLDVLFQLELQIFAEIIHVDFKAIDEKSGGANVCH